MQCNGKWSTYPQHDYYYYQYLLNHAIKAKNDDAIQKIMRDFKWINVKLQLDNTIYNLCVDMENVIAYLKGKETEVEYNTL